MSERDLKSILDELLARALEAPDRSAEWEQELRQRAADRERDRRLTVERRLPAAFRWARRGSAELASRVAHPDVDAALDELALATRAVIVGDAGTGKTSLAVAGLREALERRRRAVWRSSFELALAGSRSSLGDVPLEVDGALRAELMVLDELGSEPRAPGSAVVEVLYERHLASRATWVTTPFDEGELARRYGEGIARRVYERATVIRLA